MISHKHKCIFIHIPKCGGQSVEHLFLQENGLNWDTRAPLLLCPNEDPRRGPPRLAHLTWQEYINCGHVSAELMREYTTFSVVRNPYKRVESLYRFLGYDASIPFEYFVTNILSHQIEAQGELYWFFRPQYEYLSSKNGDLMVDNLIRLENINNDLPRLLKKFGIGTEKIPHVNKAGHRGFLASLNIRLKHARVGVYSLLPKVNNDISWNDQLREKIFDLYECDFKKFNY